MRAVVKQPLAVAGVQCVYEQLRECDHRCTRVVCALKRVLI